MCTVEFYLFDDSFIALFKSTFNCKHYLNIILYLFYMYYWCEILIYYSLLLSSLYF